MNFDFRISLIVVLACGAAVYGVSKVPALTSGGSSSASGVSQAEFEAIVDRERKFCQSQPDDINCQCFAEKSGHVLSQRTPRVNNATYVDKRDLARGQAANSC